MVGFGGPDPAEGGGQVALGHPDQGRGDMLGMGQPGPSGGGVAADAGRGGVDEALDHAPVDGLDVGVVAGRLGDGPQQGAVGGVHVGQALQGLPALDQRVAAAPQPARAHLPQLLVEVADEMDEQVLAVGEVPVEGGAGLAGGRHQVVHRELAERPLAQQPLGRLQDLPLGVLAAAAPAARFDLDAANHRDNLTKPAVDAVSQPGWRMAPCTPGVRE
jgi:hypothetical protein